MDIFGRTRDAAAQFEDFDFAHSLSRGSSEGKHNFVKPSDRLEMERGCIERWKVMGLTHAGQ